MKVDLSFNDALQGMVADVLRSEQICEKEQAELMRNIGKTIKKEVVAVLPRSDQGGAYKHMRDDVKVTVPNAKTGATGVIVHGGKETAYKWHMLDDGTRNPDGTVHTPAIHFTQKALTYSAQKIDKLIDELEEKIAND